MAMGTDPEVEAVAAADPVETVAEEMAEAARRRRIAP
jgi:hypothetical protein